jgi:thiol-activated cytolysin
VYSVEQAFLKLGASYNWTTGNVSGTFQKSSEHKTTSLMVRFVQSYYSVSCEAPSAPNSFISPKATFEDFKLYAGDGNPPAYIASVTYGRELWMLVESNPEQDKLQATLSAAYNAVAASGKFNLDAEQQKILNESTIQVLIMGGNGPAAIEALTGDKVKKVKEYLDSGANFSRTSPGVIISYTVRYLKDNEVARVSSVSGYTIKTYEPKLEPIPLSLMRVTWQTNGDGKDGDSQPFVDVYDKQGRHVGNIACCSSGNSGSDVWDSGRTETRNMSVLVGGLTLDDFISGRFSAGRNGGNDGKDDWDYTATVELVFSDNQKITKQCSGRNFCSNSW